MRELKANEAIREAFAQALSEDERVLIMGLGVPDPKGVFGTTAGLQEQFGADRVMDMPCAEAAMTGVVLGAAAGGMRPVISHQRLDFAMLAMDQMVTQAAKWRYMFGGKMSAPVVFRMVLGRGWGQGPQHAQCLHSWFAHIPGLKVVMPTTAADAKGLMLAAIRDPDPVVYIEHRWLHNTRGDVPEAAEATPIGKAKIQREGKHVTVVSLSVMTLEALSAADTLAAEGVELEVVDLRSLRPLDRDAILASVRKTGRLIVADTAWLAAGMSAEIMAIVAESAHGALQAPPVRLGFADCPTPTSRALAADWYPRAGHIVAAARRLLNMPPNPADLAVAEGVELDKPDPSFTGPF